MKCYYKVDSNLLHKNVLNQIETINDCDNISSFFIEFKSHFTSVF